MATRTRKKVVRTEQIDTASKTVGRVLEELRVALDDAGLVEEYFTTSPCDLKMMGNSRKPVNSGTIWDEIGYWGIAVYPVTGGSEGVYVHIDLIGCKADAGQHQSHLDRPRHALAFVKVWTWDMAWKVAAMAAHLLGA